MGQKTDQWLPEAEGGEKLTTREQPEGIYGVMERFHMLIVVVFTQLYGFVKTHEIVHPQKVNFNVCKI